MSIVNLIIRIEMQLINYTTIIIPQGQTTKYLQIMI